MRRLPKEDGSYDVNSDSDNGLEEATHKPMKNKIWDFCSCRGFPISVFFIVSNEFCERFSYYGMRAVLVLYLTFYLHFDEDTSTSLYHTFIVFCYATPLLGAIIADSILGKFKTIWILSIVYALGNVALTLSAIPPALNCNETAYRVMTFGGLALIALGTGGIKPCVSAFGGDQFKDHQKHLLSKFFSIFYFSINAGSVISTIMTPVLRGDVNCFGPESCPSANQSGNQTGSSSKCGGEDCYALSFGVPAVLMMVSLMVFLGGNKMYTKNKPPGGSNIFFQFIGCILTATKNRFRRRNQGRKGVKFIHYACPQYSAEFADDVWAVLRVLVMFLPLPVFWSLFDQQGSRWTLQATRMNGDIGPLGHIKPDQMQALNAILILVFIPLFETIVYPILNKLHILRRPLQRMVCGMLLAGLAFMVAGFIQLSVQTKGYHPPPMGQARVTFTNAIPDSSIELLVDNQSFVLPSHKSAVWPTSDPTGVHTLVVVPELNSNYSNLSIADLSFEDGELAELIIGTNNMELIPIKVAGNFNVSDEEATVRTINAAGGSLSIELFNSKECENIDYQFKAGSLDYGDYSVFENVSVAEYSYLVNTSVLAEEAKTICGDTELVAGGVYTVIVTRYNDNFQVNVVENSSPDSVSILMQIPMYVLITAGEIMFSITGLEFAYSQAPVSMKSICQAGWLLTVCFGNIIDVTVTQSSFIADQAGEFFFFSGLIALMAVILAVMSLFYKYVPQSTDAVQQKQDRQDETAGLVSESSQAGSYNESKTDISEL